MQSLSPIGQFMERYNNVMSKYGQSYGEIWPLMTNQWKAKARCGQFLPNYGQIVPIYGWISESFKSSDNDNDNEKLCKYIAIYDADVGYF